MKINQIADVTAIVPYYNSRKTIDRAIQSILNQTLQVKEIIVIDDGSEENQKITANDFKNLSNTIKIISTKNSGASSARNTGVLESNTKYLAFLDADDAWHPQKIEIQYKFMETSKATLSAHGYIPNKTKETPRISDNCINNINSTFIKKYKFIFGSVFFTPTVMVLRENFILFDQRLSRSEDYKCWVENFKKDGFFFLDANLSFGFKNPMGASGLSFDILKMHKEYIKSLYLLLKDDRISLLFFLSSFTIEKIKYPLRKIKWQLKNK